MNHYSAEDIAALSTKQYHKTALTKARRLTEQDYQERRGVIQTLEGPRSFEIGDYLCVGIANEEWPMSQETFNKNKEYFDDTKDDDFALYTTKSIKYAVFIEGHFSVGDGSKLLVSDESGRYIVHNGNPAKAWIVDKSIFDNSYEKI